MFPPWVVATLVARSDFPLLGSGGGSGGQLGGGVEIGPPTSRGPNSLTPAASVHSPANLRPGEVSAQSAPCARWRSRRGGNTAHFQRTRPDASCNMAIICSWACLAYTRPENNDRSFSEETNSAVKIELCRKCIGRCVIGMADWQRPPPYV